MHIAKAILSLRPDAKFNVREGVIEWLDTKQTQPKIGRAHV